MKDNNDELKRILEMVESGRISAADGAKLLASTPSASTAEVIVCPYCAEPIPSRTRSCPECGSNLETAVSSVPSTGFQSLSGLGKFLVVYTLLVTGFWLFSSLFSNGMRIAPASVFGTLLAVLGLMGGLLILKGKSNGWNLCLLWSGLQMITVIIRGQIINQQVLHLGANFHTNGQGFGINLVGIILLILFIKVKPNAPQYTSGL